MSDLNQFQSFAKQTKRKTVSNNNAVIYTRVSDFSQSDNTSLESQREHCTKFAEHKQYTILDYFGGTYESAKTDDRKEFQRMLTFVKRKKVSYIIVFSIDRFSRAGASAISVVEALRIKGINVLSVTQPVDTETSSGNLFQNINLLFSKYDNDLRRDKTITGMQQLLSKGYYLGKAPIGYKNVRDEKNNPLIVPNDDAKYIKKIFNWKANENLKSGEIIKRLSLLGFKIYKERLSAILRNPLYCGLLTHSLLDNKVIKGQHKGLISKSLFLEVNGILAKNNQGYKQNKVNDNLPLKGFTTCNTCGTKLTGYVVKAKGIHYYKCKTVGCGCNRSTKAMHSKFEALLNKYQLSDATIALLKIQLKHVYDYFNKTSKDTLAPLKFSLKTINDKIDKVEERYVVGEIDNTLYQKFITKFKVEQQEIELEIQKTSLNSSNLNNYTNNGLKLLANLNNIWKLGDYNAKQQLQNILFPNGITYNREKDEVRTNKVNSFLRLSNSLSAVLRSDNKEQINSDINSLRLGSSKSLEQTQYIKQNQYVTSCASMKEKCIEKLTKLKT